MGSAVPMEMGAVADQGEEDDVGSLGQRAVGAGIGKGGGRGGARVPPTKVNLPPGVHWVRRCVILVDSHQVPAEDVAPATIITSIAR